MTALLNDRLWRASLAVALVVALVVALSACSDDSSIAPPTPPESATTAARVASAQSSLTELQDALESRDMDRVAGLATADARPLVEAMAANVETLDLDSLSFRLVDEVALGPEESGQYGSAAWAGTVELSYRLAGWDQQPTRLETRVVFAPSGGEILIAGFGGGDGRTPLWVTGRVTSLSSDRALVIARGDGGRRYLDLASRALVAVGKVLPGWRGKLVIEAPQSEDQLNQVLAVPQGQYANIAAVTTTVDGSLVPGAPVHVFLNPRVFDELGPRGAQIVVSHETTHVATDAAFAELPTWLLEGFADYVALAHAGIPVETAASQVLARIRKNGPPDHLPTAEDLDPTAPGLGATYEEAWLATRFIGREHGERRLVAFYRTVGAGTSVADAFASVLGTTEDAFVKRWRADLRDLAGDVAG